MNCNPVTPHCARLFDARRHAVIGVSPFNSFFTRDILARTVKWAQCEFDAFHIYVPDGPAGRTLQALGYDDARARKKARRQGNYLRNKIADALSKNDLCPTQYDALILNSARLESVPRYAELHAEIHVLFEGDAAFGDLCRQASGWVLESMSETCDKTRPENWRDLAVSYLLAEMPFFIDTPRILGVEASVFCYAQCPSFLRELYKNRRGDIVSERQGFVEITPIGIG